MTARLGISSLTLGLALTLPTLTACGKVREISACRALAHETNPTLDQIEELSKKPAADQQARAEQQARMAKLYGELAKRLKAQATGTTPLATAVKDYAGILEATSNALKNQSEATRSGTFGRTTELRRELDRLVKRERSAITRIETECHS